jgi:hypothetical protein
MIENIQQLVEAFLVEQSKPEMTMQEKLNRSNDQRDRAVAIADGIMQWDKPSDARKSCKDLSDLKKEIQDNDRYIEMQ